MIVQASNDTGACYGVAKCAEVVFERGKMVKGEGFQMLNERMKSIDPDQNEIYKFLGVQQADGIKKKERSVYQNKRTNYQKCEHDNKNRIK